MATPELMLRMYRNALRVNYEDIYLSRIFGYSLSLAAKRFQGLCGACTLRVTRMNLTYLIDINNRQEDGFKASVCWSVEK